MRTFESSSRYDYFLADPDQIPQELKTRRQWVVWRTENREGKPTKVPYSPRDPSRKAKANDPETWGNFNTALRVAKSNGFSGVGYEFSPDDPFTGIDLDKCRDSETEELKYCAQVVIGYLASYSEGSPSGIGVHIITKARWPDRGRKKVLPCGMEVEVYDRRRYFTITGARLEGTSNTIEVRQTELEALHTDIFSKPKGSPKDTGPGPSPLDLSDQELIDKARQAANGEKFEKLWRGDLIAYASASEATAALLSHLVFWCGPDPERVDRLFRQSGLMREKCDRAQSGSTWGRLEIDKAIARVREFYTHGQRTNASERKEPSSQAATISPAIPIFPREVMTGAAGAFARCYASYLETPEAFLLMDYLTLLGHLVSDRITLASEIAPQPRLFTVNLGESADARKSTSIDKSVNFFLDMVSREDINPIFGVGSAEGLAKAFSKHSSIT